jgi:hypothetical protein
MVAVMSRKQYIRSYERPRLANRVLRLVRSAADRPKFGHSPPARCRRVRSKPSPLGGVDVPSRDTTALNFALVHKRALSEMFSAKKQTTGTAALSAAACSLRAWRRRSQSCQCRWDGCRNDCSRSRSRISQSIGTASEALAIPVFRRVPPDCGRAAFARNSGTIVSSDQCIQPGIGCGAGPILKT